MNTKKLLLTVSVMLLVTLWSCSSDNPTESDPNQNPSTTAPLSKLSDIQAKVFIQSCALSGCHGTTNNQAG